MLYRCYNEKAPSYENYGGRGIEVCPEWKDNYYSFFEWSLSNGWKLGLSIDRIDVNGHYSPLNCRLVTIQVNNIENKRSLIHNITYNGETKGVREWCRLLNLSYKKMYYLVAVKKIPGHVAIQNQLISNHEDDINKFHWDGSTSAFYEHSDKIPTLQEATIEFEFNYIMEAVKIYGSIKRAAEVLGITRDSANNKIKKYESWKEYSQ